MMRQKLLVNNVVHRSTSANLPVTANNSFYVFYVMHCNKFRQLNDDKGGAKYGFIA
ncbi:MAG: hypothetical protein LBG97_04470 [Coriobacteriales bacterium]|jgi:hypothetical protein|nr:hypothetical protein [Coriobacteriales bacterium]